MKRAHDRYEALAGAMVLGEATFAEREAFEAHAAQCAQCAEDLSSFVPLRDAVAAASTGEVWRPSVSDQVYRSVQATKVLQRRRIVSTFAYAIAASVALNIAFISGFAGRALDTLRSLPEYTYSPVGTITLEHRVPKIASIATAQSEPRARHSKPRALARPDRLAPNLSASDGVPDVFSGIAVLENGSGERSVAAASGARCAERTETTSVVPQPCNSQQP
jgi:hypothetical protein